jgi:hypothetical protein
MARARASEPAPATRARAGALRIAAVPALLAAAAAIALAPLADAEHIPGEPDFWQHVYLIGQAQGALAEGQLPIRVAPAMDGGLNYPIFQFYSPLPYQLAAVVHRWWSPQNAFVAYRLVLWAALAAGALFTWRLARRLSGSASGAVLAALAYVLAPYLLVNVHARSAWTEAIAQGVLPAALWYAFRLLEDADLAAWIGSAVSWFALATTHLITFAYGGLLAGLLFLVVAAVERRGVAALLRVAGGAAAGCALATWHLWPVLTVPVAIKAQGLGNPFDVHALTPLAGLLSPVSVAPSGAEHLLKHSPGLHPSVGWPMLAAAAWSAWALARRRAALPRPGVAAALLAVFAVAFVLAWSPVDLWSVLPAPLRVVQFPYRLLAHVGWSGALLVALAVATLLPGPALRSAWLAAGAAAALLGGVTWLRVPPGLAPVRVADVMRFRNVTAWIPGLTAQPVGFEVRSEALGGPGYVGPRARPAPGACRRLAGGVACVVSADGPTVVELPAFWYPGLLGVAVNGAAVEPVPLAGAHGLVAGASVGAGQSEIRLVFRGAALANAVSALAALALAIAGAVALVRRLRRAGARDVAAA